MGVVSDEVIKEKDREIAGLIKEISDLLSGFKAATDEEQKTEIIDEITEKEKDLRIVRQKKATLKSILS